MKILASNVIAVIFLGLVLASSAHDTTSALRERILRLQLAIRDVRNEQRELAHMIEQEPDLRNVSSISFMAYKDEQQVAAPGDVITWDGLLVNNGNGFSIVTNSFLCPVDGYYFFQFNLYNGRANQGQSCSATLVKDGNNQVQGKSQIFGEQTISLVVGQNAFISCAEGNRVTLQSDFEDNVIGEENLPRSSVFIGFLVFETPLE